MKRFGFLGLLLGSVALIGAGCGPGGEFAEYDLGNCVETTPWGCITDKGIDTTLLGDWTLQSQVVTTSSGVVTNPFSGSAISFDVETLELEDVDDDGNVIGYNEVVTTQYYEDFSTATEVSGSCTVSGGSAGSWAAFSEFDLDVAPVDGEYPLVYMLRLSSDPENPSVECTDSGAINVTARNAVSPLVVGPGVELDGNGYTATNRYVYSIDATGSVLTVTSTTVSPQVVNTYVR